MKKVEKNETILEHILEKKKYIDSFWMEKIRKFPVQISIIQQMTFFFPFTRYVAKADFTSISTPFFDFFFSQ